MPDSPQDDKWYVRHRWLILAALGASGGLITQFHHIEPNVKRMAELAGFYNPVPPKKAEPPSPQVVAEAPKPLPPPKQTVAPLRNSELMMDMLRALKGEKWEPDFNAHFKNRETALVLVLTEVQVADGRFKFEGEYKERWIPTYYVTPRNRADLKKFKPGARLLIEGDLDRYVDRGPDRDGPDEAYIVRARVTEAPDGIVTGSIKR